MTHAPPSRPGIGRHAWYVALARAAEYDAWRNVATPRDAMSARNIVGVRWARAVALALGEVTGVGQWTT